MKRNDIRKETEFWNEDQWLECMNARMPDQESLNRERMEAFFSGLTSQEEMLVKMRFGLTDGKIHSLEEVAEYMGITCERVRMIESRIFRRNHGLNRKKKLEDYLE